MCVRCARFTGYRGYRLNSTMPAALLKAAGSTFTAKSTSSESWTIAAYLAFWEWAVSRAFKPSAGLSCSFSQSVAYTLESKCFCNSTLWKVKAQGNPALAKASYLFFSHVVAVRVCCSQNSQWYLNVFEASQLKRLQWQVCTLCCWWPLVQSATKNLKSSTLHAFLRCPCCTRRS